MNDTPAWKRPVHLARAVLTLLVVLIIALVLDLWIRFFVLPRFRASGGRDVTGFNRVIRAWGVSTFRVTRLLMGLKLEVWGSVPDSGRYLVLANHQSSIDIPALIAILRTMNLKFVAMEELKYGKPAVSVTLRNGGFVFLGKRSLAEDMANLLAFSSVLERFDGSPVIFPEGIRTFDGEIRPFQHAGTEVVRRSCRLPILPVTIDGLWQARSIKELHLLVGSRVTFRIGDPIPFRENEEKPREHLETIETIIKDGLAKIRGW